MSLETLQTHIYCASAFNDPSDAVSIMKYLIKKLHKLHNKPYITFKANDDILKEIEPHFVQKGYFIGKYVVSWVPDHRDSMNPVYGYYLTTKKENIPENVSLTQVYRSYSNYC